MLVYITKYALTDGAIQEQEVDLSGQAGKMVTWREKGYMLFCHKPYWHLTREEAVAHVKELRARKLASLRKSIAKIEAMAF